MRHRPISLCLGLALVVASCGSESDPPPTAPAAPTVEVVDSAVRPSYARIDWQVRDGDGLTFVIQRRHADQPWKMRAMLSPDASGRITLEDNAVLPGEPYTYGVVLPGETFAREGSTITVDIPR